MTPSDVRVTVKQDTAFQTCDPIDFGVATKRDLANQRGEPTNTTVVLKLAAIGYDCISADDRTIEEANHVEHDCVFLDTSRFGHEDSRSDECGDRDESAAVRVNAVAAPANDDFVAPDWCKRLLEQRSPYICVSVNNFNDPVFSS